MSFSSDVKDELSRQYSSARHCQIAEIAAIISMNGKVMISVDDRFCIKVHTENVAVARKFFTLIRKVFQAQTEISIRQNAYLKKSRTYIITIPEHEDCMKILQAAKLLNEYQEVEEEMSMVNNIILQRSCCKRAFIRGAFLASGSISDPEKTYHFEIVCASREKAEQLREIINSFEMDAKIVLRKKYFVVYIKEGSQIVDILNVMEAHVALMKLENVRILKEMRNSVNRKVNCETANINKTVSAAIKQAEDIKYIRDTIGFERLSEGLEEIAWMRLKHPDATLKELGAMLSPPVGKSGVNHRLRKLSNIAESLRENKEENYDNENN
jgi:DNA-binding protein WhiA